jgi:hypothetical protein
VPALQAIRDIAMLASSHGVASQVEAYSQADDSHQADLGITWGQRNF